MSIPALPAAVRPRMSAEERRGAILVCAKQQLLAQGYFPIPFEELARLSGISKPLVYAYFKTQADLADAMLAATMACFDRAAFDAACVSGATTAIIAVGSDLYFSAVAEHGPILHLLLNDRYLAGKLDCGITDYIARCRRQAVRALGVNPGLRPRDAGAAIELFLAIIEEAGRAAFRGEMDRSVARQLGHELVLAGLAALGPAGSGLPLSP